MPVCDVGVCLSLQGKDCLIKVEIIDQSDLTKLRGIVTGPPDTPFEGTVPQVPHLKVQSPRHPI